MKTHTGCSLNTEGTSKQSSDMACLGPKTLFSSNPTGQPDKKICCKDRFGRIGAVLGRGCPTPTSAGRRLTPGPAPGMAPGCCSQEACPGPAEAEPVQGRWQDGRERQAPALRETVWCNSVSRRHSVVRGEVRSLRVRADGRITDVSEARECPDCILPTPQPCHLPMAATQGQAHPGSTDLWLQGHL